MMQCKLRKNASFDPFGFWISGLPSEFWMRRHASLRSGSFREGWWLM